MIGDAWAKFAPPAVRLEARDDGSQILSNPVPLHDHPPTLLSRLCHWAAETPDAVFLAERDGPGWRTRTYRETATSAGRLAGGLLALGCSPERPLMLLSHNSIVAAELMLGAMAAGVPSAPISTAYALLSSDFGRLKQVKAELTPGALFLGDGAAFGAANAALSDGITPVIAPEGGGGIIALDSVLSAEPCDLVASAAGLDPDSIAKVLFTSGSTGRPKGVVNTHRMLCANQTAIAQAWPFLTNRPPRLVDWLPWNHTFGGNFCFNMALFHGGALYIDDGRPTPGAIARTVENLRLGRPNLYFNVPAGYEALLPILEADTDLARDFLGPLDLMFSAGAALPNSARERLEAVSRRNLGRIPPLVTGWGSTETAPCATLVHFPTAAAGNIGLPTAGTEIKMTPNGQKMELRVRGPLVTPRYWRRPKDSQDAFDDEGFYKIGDAGILVDADQPELGIVFDGRTAENFKLKSGTWVSVGALRLAAIDAARPLLADAVITGHDRDEVGLLAFPNLAACRARLGSDAFHLRDDEVLAHPAIRAAICAGLQAHNLGKSSSARFARVLIQVVPPRADGNEITDKGYLNQRAVLEARAEDVEGLYRDDHRVV